MARGKRSPYVNVAAFIAVIYLLYMLFGASSHTDFRRTTEEGMVRKQQQVKEAASDVEIAAKARSDLDDILRKQEEVDAVEKPRYESGAKNLPIVESIPMNTKTADEFEDVSIAGRVTMPKAKDKSNYPVDMHVPIGDGEEQAFNGGKIEKVVDLGMEDAREELERILKKSPIIIFSKTTCPYSRRAKALLLDTYSIVPSPYVVELDLLTEEIKQEPPTTLGRKLQDLLTEVTGRKTVPNIMINARSIGGSDDIARLDAEGTLIEEIKKWGGRRIVEIQKRGGGSEAGGGG